SQGVTHAHGLAQLGGKEIRDAFGGRAHVRVPSGRDKTQRRGSGDATDYRSFLRRVGGRAADRSGGQSGAETAATATTRRRDRCAEGEEGMTTVEFLAEWMIRSAILIAGGALLLWLLRVKDSSIRAVVWTAMLCGSLA